MLDPMERDRQIVDLLDKHLNPAEQKVAIVLVTTDDDGVPHLVCNGLNVDYMRTMIFSAIEQHLLPENANDAERAMIFQGQR